MSSGKRIKANGESALGWMRQWQQNWNEVRERVRPLIAAEDERRTAVYKTTPERLKERMPEPEPEKFRYEHPDRIREEMERRKQTHDGEHHRAGGTGKADSGGELHEAG